jgi:hypothetical protein
VSGTGWSLRLAAAACAAAFALPAAAFVRSSDRSTGKALFWPMPVVPYHVSDAPAAHAPSCAATAAGYPALDVARTAFSAWNQAGANLELVFAGPLTDVRTGIDGPHDNLVVFRQGFCSANPDALACMNGAGSDCGNTFDCFEDHTPGDRFIVALTSVLYEPGTGRIVNADIEVNGWNGVSGPPLSGGASGPANGWYFTCDRPASQCTTYGEAGCFYIDLQNTLTHEAGHFIGLSHPCGDPGLPSCASSTGFAETTMFPQTTPGDVAKRSLSADDVAGIRAIYPDGGGCGCGSGGAGAGLAALLAVVAWRPRRRARR